MLFAGLNRLRPGRPSLSSAGSSSKVAPDPSHTPGARQYAAPGSNVNKDKEQTVLRHCDQCPYSMDLASLNKWRRARQVLHLTLEDPSYSKLARAISIAIMVLILASTLSLVLETLPSLEGHWIWEFAEAFVSIAFTIEYLLRLGSSKHLYPFMTKALNIVDLIAILPFYWNLIFADQGNGGDTLRVFRVVRLARVFRLFKISRYSSYMKILATTMSRSRDAFGLLFFFLLLAIIVFSSLMYFAERGTYDELSGAYVRSDGKPSPFSSIPASFYWCVVTMTTVGYGDVVPIEELGKLICCVTMICGILVFALPVTILGSNFQAVYDHETRRAAVRKAALTAEVSEGHVELMRLLNELRHHRNDLHATLASIRVLVQKTDSDVTSQAIWESVDNVIIFALDNVEHALETSVVKSHRGTT